LEVGVDEDPVAAFRNGGYGEELARERGTSSVESAYERQ
jgi:L-rhamnose isomerase